MRVFWNSPGVRGCVTIYNILQCHTIQPRFFRYRATTPLWVLSFLSWVFALDNMFCFCAFSWSIFLEVDNSSLSTVSNKSFKKTAVPLML